jgi:membrane-associated phospholipid phosphatase
VFPLRFTFERPAVDGVFGPLYGALAGFDLPYNRAPSLHIAVLVVLWARFAPALTRVQRACLGSWFVLIGVSVLTTYQHHVIDVPAGLLLGTVAVTLTAPAAARRGSPFRQARSAWASRSRALSQSRVTVRLDKPSTSAISASSMPPK